MSALRICIAVATSLLSQLANGAEPASLARYLSPDANCVLAIDVRKALETPLATREGWGKSLEAAYVERSVMLPPEAELLLAASSIRPDRGFESDSSVSVLQLSREFSLATIARSNGGRIEQVRGTDVVAGIGDTIVARLDKTVLGIFAPASRQLAGRWLSDVSAARPTLSPFLASSVARAGKDHPIVFAIDLQDLVSADDAEKKLEASGVLKGFPDRARDVAVLLQSARGAVVEIAISTEARATARLELGQPVKTSAAVMKRIIQHVLTTNGMQLDELGEMELSVSGQTVTGTTVLSRGSLRRVLSLLDVPTPDLESTGASASADTPKGETSAQVRGAKSQAYFRSVTTLLSDLRGDRSKQDPRGGMDAVWMDKYAQKIDGLPVLNVDEAIVDWGTKTAQTLRVMAGSRRGAGLSAGAQKSGLRTGVYFDSYYGVGVNSTTATAKDANQIDMQAGNTATANRVEGWRLIDNATAEIRKKATQQYGIEF